ncbi:MAG: serine/threonine protein kinase [Sandaracinaceae bacterium]|nr:serine/threonine protein kinase [Sandaracinaceae bacterium]
MKEPPNDGGAKRKVPPPPPPGRALASVATLEARVAALPEAKGVVTGARRADVPGERSTRSSAPPTRTDLPALAPVRRKGRTQSTESAELDALDALDASDASAASDTVDSASIDIALDAIDVIGDGPPSDRPPQLPAICTFGRYEILGRIAFGGMAEIFLGRETTSLGAVRYLAIKRILPHVADDEQFVEMFLDEARLAIQLNHANICHIYEFGELDDAFFIAMEWVNGVPLGKLIRRARAAGGLPAEVAVRVIADIAGALAYAHNARDAVGRPLEIVHRDVSPHNIMVAYDGQVKLLDFGIAKATTHASKTQAGTVKGKFSYMAPEQCLNKPLDGRADVFALGICLWETLAGRALYTRDNEFETMKAIIEEDPPPLAWEREDAPDGLDAIIKKALAKARENRHGSAAELQTELERWLAAKGHVVNATRVAELMQRLYAEQIRRGPLVDSTPFGQSFQRARSPDAASSPSAQAALPIAEAPSGSAPAMALPAPPARTPVAWIAIVAALVVALVAVGTVAVWPRGEPPPTEPTLTAPEPRAPDPEPESLADPRPVTPEPAPVPPPAPLALGVLVVTSVPTGASVRLDGEPVAGRTPITLARLPAGGYAILVEREGFEPHEARVEVPADGEARVEARLTRADRGPERAPGRLSINTRPWSKVYVGNRLIGTTPIAEASVTSGRLRLRLVDRDGNVHQRVVDVPANGTERVYYELSP